MIKITNKIVHLAFKYLFKNDPKSHCEPFDFNCEKCMDQYDEDGFDMPSV